MIRRGDSDEDYVRCAAIFNALHPHAPIGLADFGDRPCVLLSGDDGYAIVKESSLDGCAFTMIRVLPHARGRGVGRALLAAGSEQARALGKRALFGRVEAGDEASFAWVTRRGFVEVSRDFEQVRQLGKHELEPEPPQGIEVRPAGDGDLEAMYAVAVEAIPDIAVAAHVSAPSYEHWLREHDRSTFHVALDDGKAIGFATLSPFGITEDTLEHELTAVLHSHRRRGIARALKRTQIAWAAERGYRRLVTWTQSGNVAMRSLNLSLGYAERPDTISVKGPLQ